MPDEASDVVEVDSEHFFDVYSADPLEFSDVHSDVYFDCETPHRGGHVFRVLGLAPKPWK